MTIQQELDNLIREQMEELQESQHQQGGVYLSQLHLQETGEQFSLEIETVDGSVAIAYPVASEDVDEACSYLTDSLADKGIKVYTDYEAFKEAKNIRG